MPQKIKVYKSVIPSLPVVTSLWFIATKLNAFNISIFYIHSLRVLLNKASWHTSEKSQGNIVLNVREMSGT